MLLQPQPPPPLLHEQLGNGETRFSTQSSLERDLRTSLRELRSSSTRPTFGSKGRVCRRSTADTQALQECSETSSGDRVRVFHAEATV